MHKLHKHKVLLGMITCLLMGMLAGGIGLCAYAAEVVDAAVAEGAQAIPVSPNVSCTVDNGGTVTYAAVLDRNLPVSDDQKIYLLEMAPYEYTITESTAVIEAKTADFSGVNHSFSFPVNFRMENTRLYSKFAMAVKSGGVLHIVTEPMYITNPEALAQNAVARSARSKKSTQGVNFNNLFLDGTYGPELGEIYRTIQVLNTGQCETLTNPMSRAGAKASDSHRPKRCMYYMFNASDAAGVKTLAGSLEYYVANSRGGENWIIGNEVNVREWNYMAWTDWETYIREYAQAFRVMYNAIMSTNANAKVYVSIDHIWDKNLSPSNKGYYQCMDGKDFLERFCAYTKKSGDINWGVSQHPYTNPMTYPKFWDMSGCRNGAVYDTEVRTGQVVTFQNLSVLTNFMQTPAMLDRNGNTRPIILSEIGIANAQGGEVQAAALCASYAAALSNPFIDEIIYLNTYSDSAMDTRLGNFSRQVYDGMDGAEAQAYFEWAKNYIGIHDWSEILW